MDAHLVTVRVNLLDSFGVFDFGQSINVEGTFQVVLFKGSKDPPHTGSTTVVVFACCLVVINAPGIVQSEWIGPADVATLSELRVRELRPRLKIPHQADRQSGPMRPFED